MVIGSDWRGKKVVGEKYAREVVFFDRMEGYSTTNILKKQLWGDVTWKIKEY